MILAIDSASAACTAALLSAEGDVFAERHEDIGRGHAERLMPMVADLLGDHIPSQILVGVGPGSFTGLRVAIAAAHGMAIGWSVPLSGFDSLALVAAGAEGDGPVGVAMLGGHGEWFVAQYDRPGFAVRQPVTSMTPGDAARAISGYRPDVAAAASSVSAGIAPSIRELRKAVSGTDYSPHRLRQWLMSLYAVTLLYIFFLLVRSTTSTTVPEALARLDREWLFATLQR